MLVRTMMATLLAAGLVVSAPAAQAAEQSHRDAAKDVLSRTLHTDTPPRRAEPARRLGDVVRTTVSYGTDVVVTTRFRSLTSAMDTQLTWFVLPSEGEDDGYWTATLVVPKGRDTGDFTLLDPIANQPRCGAAALDRPARTVTLTIEGSCLGDPRWVKVGHLVQLYSAGPDAREYADDAFRDGVVTGNPRLSPKIKRG